MDEKAIQAALKQNIPTVEETKPAEPTAPTVTEPKQGPDNFDLDELTQYKLHQHFGEDFREGDPIARQELSYIYEQVSKKLGNSDYPYVVSKIDELRRMLGISHANNQRHKLYEWLRLDNHRSRVELEMDAVRSSI